MHLHPRAVPLSGFKWIAALAMLTASGCSSTSTSTPSDASDAAPDGATQNDAPDLAQDGPPLAPREDANGFPPPPNGSTGALCTTATECMGPTPVCRTKSHTGIIYPGGYCSSACDPTKNDPMTGIDPECPSNAGTCVPGATPACLALCTDKAGAEPCRDQYSCFLASNLTAVCLPSSISQCDPTVKGSCPSSDAGTPQTCTSVGIDPVGQCDEACDYFAQSCASIQAGDASAQPRACYANELGEGVCAVPSAMGADGATCVFFTDCAAGLGCRLEGNAGACRPYCGGAGNVACNNGKQCVDSSMTVPKSVAGYCAG